MIESGDGVYGWGLCFGQKGGGAMNIEDTEE